MYVMDVTDLKSIESVQKDLSSRGLGVDVLVNNAAIDPKVKSGLGIVETSRLEHFSREQWDLQLSVGLTGAFLCSQIFGTAMVSRQGVSSLISLLTCLFCS